MSLIQIIKERIVNRHKYICRNCRFGFKLNKKQEKLTMNWNGPYCPKCGKKATTPASSKSQK